MHLTFEDQTVRIYGAKSHIGVEVFTRMEYTSTVSSFSSQHTFTTIMSYFDKYFINFFYFYVTIGWYTVSHEGNRYGVTFHSRLFANEFMKCLEAEYGRWNTANILKIQRDGQNFVILNIFFHDLFTPWFYTQGPIKNDEEWIRTDFKNICHTVQDNKNTSHHLTNSNTVTTPWIPWTKVAYIPSLTETSVKKHLTRNTNKIKNKTKNDNKTNQLVNVIILEDIIECNGLDKGVQTQQKRLQTHKTEIDTVV
ncbi:hypothetical protein KSF78_0007116 [Schistosoma japonicum]|nr:hypothetical protein KSF78_0007116 [Schistosoma japonicum]